MNISPTSKKFMVVPEAVVSLEDVKLLLLTIVLAEGIVVDGDISQFEPIMHMMKEVPILTQEQILQRQVALQNEISGLSKLMPVSDGVVGNSGEGIEAATPNADGDGNQEEKGEGVSEAAEATSDTTEAGKSSSTVQ